MEKEINVLKIKLENRKKGLRDKLYWIKSSVKTIEHELKKKKPEDMSFNSCGEFQSSIYNADMAIIEICMLIDNLNLLKKIK